MKFIVSCSCGIVIASSRDDRILQREEREKKARSNFLNITVLSTTDIQTKGVQSHWAFFVPQCRSSKDSLDDNSFGLQVCGMLVCMVPQLVF